ncbi:Peptide-methionine (S)-S-oxide reductase MsrA, partial [hydrothermal vent metagenome]
MSSYDTQLTLPTKDQALAGRLAPMVINPNHFITGHKIVGPFDSPLQQAVFGLGCFWGAERKFWEANVQATAVGYTAGHTQNPHYEEV